MYPGLSVGRDKNDSRSGEKSLHAFIMRPSSPDATRVDEITMSAPFLRALEPHSLERFHVITGMTAR